MGKKLRSLLIVSVIVLTVLIVKAILFFTATPEVTINYVTELNRISRPADYDPNDNAAQSTPEAVSEELAFNVLTLQYQASELSMQVGWLRAHLGRCLAKLEKQYELEPIEFDWSEAMGFPKIKRDPNHPERYLSKLGPFYVPYRGIKMREIKAEKYTYMAKLSATEELTNSSLANNMLGMDKYIKHLEERLKRLEDHLKK